MNFEITWLKDKTVYMKGKASYDPMEKVISFHNKDETLLFTKKVESVNIIPNSLKEFKIAFKDEEEERLFEILCDKKETLELRSFRYLVNSILCAKNKASRQEKIDKK